MTEASKLFGPPGVFPTDPAIRSSSLAKPRNSHTPAPAPQPASGAQMRSYTVEPFQDEATVTASLLRYGSRAYPLKLVMALQIIRLRRRRSALQKRLLNFVAGVVAAVGVAVAVGLATLLAIAAGIALTLASLAYFVYNTWFADPQRQGEYGLLVELRPSTKAVVTSPSLEAVQKLYQVLRHRIDNPAPGEADLRVNMYTGELT